MPLVRPLPAAWLADRIMSRWKSPKVAAKRAESVEREIAKRRSEKRYSWLLIGGVTVCSLGLSVADFLWMRSRAHERHERRYQQNRQRALTNSPTPTNPAGSGLPESKL